RARKREGEIAAIDFFASSGREVVAGLLGELAGKLGDEPAGKTDTFPLADYRGRTWVTRQNVHVDRIACAWLIKRFIDPQAKFRFVPGKTYEPAHGELRFDMFDAEFTHEGDRCSFEVLLARFGLRDPGLRAIAEIVHDIDLKDGKYGRPDADGVARVISAIAMSSASDEDRIARGGAMLEDLHKLYSAG
ncbi:MAG: chromate resistance protein ChrB domain-containing protein, partial [Acidobacteriota bacterium]